MGIQISPAKNVKLIEWSLTDEMASESTIWNNRNVYFINYVHGHPSNEFKEFTFSLIFEVKDEWPKEYSFEIALGSHFVHRPETLTEEYIKFIGTFPDWANVQYWTSDYLSYQYL